MFLRTMMIASLLSLGVGATQSVQAQCNDIASGLISTSDGVPITTGFDVWGYNYQVRAFSGGYCDSLRGGACGGYDTVGLSMQWNDAWLSNRDCDGDGRLDRHYGFASYRGSGAFITNFMSDAFTNEAGQTCFWSYQFRAEAAPLDATLVDGVFYDAQGGALGAQVWADFATTQDDYSEFCF